MDPRSDMTKICRTCLAEGAPMRSIYSFGEEATTLSDILSSCSPVKVLPGDGLPDNICLNCSVEMNRAYLFWKLCQKSDATLRQLLENNPFPGERHEVADPGDDDVTEEKPCLEELIRIKVEPESADESTTRRPQSEMDADVAEERSPVGGCEICDGTFNRPNKSWRYKRTPTKRKPHQCVMCGKTFIQVKRLKSHIVGVHAGESPPKLHLCVHHDLIFEHIKWYAGENPYQCEICGETYTSLSHSCQLMTGKQPVECEVCKKKLSSPSHLKVHMRVHNGQTPFKCPACNKCFDTKKSLTMHKKKHTNEKSFQCQICNKKFSQLPNMLAHMWTHNTETPFKCPTCNQCFGTKKSLAKHKKTHTAEKPVEYMEVNTGGKLFECPTCSKRFATKLGLTRHSKTHKKEKVFKCNVCKKTFINGPYLKAHKRLHSGEKPFKCPTCGGCFGTKDTLTRHLRTHTGEKPYGCAECGQAFAQVGTLNAHKRIHKFKRKPEGTEWIPLKLKCEPV